MKTTSNSLAARTMAGISGVAVALLLFCATPTKAQKKGGGLPPDLQSQPEAQKVNPKEQADYKAIAAATDPDKKIQLGEDFLAKYPMSAYTEVVYNQLVNAYYAKQNWDKFYATSDQAVAKFPDDVDVLGLVGWVIPHVYDSNDPNAEKKLDKAESYETHALDVISTMPKPTTMTDEQFAAAKAEKSSQAHSALGLVYFRMGNGDESVKELTLATQPGGSTDPTDFYVLGVELLHMNRNTDAADAFNKCASIPGGLQDRCKQSATQALTLH